MNDLPVQDRPQQDNSAPAPGSRLAEDFVMGLRFFSRLPAGSRPHTRPDLSRIALALPFASLAIGFLPALLVLGLCWLGVPVYFAAAIGVAAIVVATGAMAEDALADSADGLFGGATIERRLEIMKDSRHGTYGVAALVLYLVLRVAGIGGLAALNPLEAVGVWLAATILARSGALWLSVDLPAAREGGASASVGRVTRQSFAVGGVFALVLAFILAAPFVGVVGFVFGIGAAALTALGWTWVCRRLLGGQTGDVIGALHALIEIAVLTVFLAFA